MITSFENEQEKKHNYILNLNIIDKIISIDIRKKEEFLTYQVNFIKSLTLKINIDSF